MNLLITILLLFLPQYVQPCRVPLIPTRVRSDCMFFYIIGNYSKSRSLKYTLKYAVNEKLKIELKYNNGIVSFSPSNIRANTTGYVEKNIGFYHHSFEAYPGRKISWSTVSRNTAPFFQLEDSNTIHKSSTGIKVFEMSFCPEEVKYIYACSCNKTMYYTDHGSMG